MPWGLDLSGLWDRSGQCQGTCKGSDLVQISHDGSPTRAGIGDGSQMVRLENYQQPSKLEWAKLRGRVLTHQESAEKYWPSKDQARAQFGAQFAAQFGAQFGAIL